MLQQEGWFDEEDHSSAVLSTRLTSDAGSWQNVCVLGVGCITFTKIEKLNG